MSGSTYLWTGAVNDLWGTPGNWFNVTANAPATAAPGALDSVEINSNASILAPNVAVNDFEVGSNDQVTLLSQSGGSQYKATTLELNAGAGLTLGSGSTLAVAKQAYVSDGATLDVSNGWYIGVSTNDPNAAKDALTSDPGWPGPITATFGELTLAPGFMGPGGQISIGSKNIGVGTLFPTNPNTGVVGTGSVVYNTNVLVWTAANPPPPNPGNANQFANFTTPGNWLDLATGKPAAQEPGIGNTLVFNAGTHIVTGYSGPVVSEVLVRTGANVSMQFQFPPVPVASSYTFNTLLLQSNSALSVGALQSDAVILQAGATLTLNGPNQGPDPMMSNITELINQGGTLALGTAPNGPANIRLGFAPITAADLAMGEHPVFGQFSNAEAYGVGLGIGGILASESVIPFTNGLKIDLGTIAHGSSLQPLNIAGESLDGTVFTDLVAGTTGSGFKISLPAQGAGTVSVDTSSVGTHTMTVQLDSSYTTASGATAAGVPQFLVLTDHIV